MADRDAREMTAEEAAGEAETLRAELRRHDHLYYVRAEPEISDAAYDRLFRRLRDLEEAHPGIVSPDSPTRRVGAEPLESLPTFEHAAPMLSLDSTQDEAELRRFDERVRKGVEGEVRYLLEPKLDGASIELVYEEGAYARAVTRGNGRRGEGVTENVRTIRSLPLRLRSDLRPVPRLLSVRGEVLMPVSAFEELNERLLEQGGEPFANPRNAAAGAIRQLDPRIAAERPLDVLAYDILRVEGVSFREDVEVVEALREWGLRVPERVRRVESVEEVLSYHREFQEERDALDYEIDGVVVKLDDLEARADLGSTSRHPRWALAFKFEPRKEVTRIERIAVSVGRTGVLTPVALLLPVEVGGVTVSRASLHNREELGRKDVREGDLVRIQRAGDVIPQVVERVEEEGRRRGEPFVFPDRCPACGTGLEEKGPFTVCPNRLGCPAQLKGRVVHFGSREALDIEGLGEETVARLVERGLVGELAHLFDLTPEQLRELPGFAEVSAAKLAAAIRSRKRVELRRFLYGLGIPEVGTAVARDLSRHFRSLQRIRAATLEELEAVPGIGPRMSEQIRAFFDEEANRTAIDHVLERGLELVPPEGPGETELSGKRFVFTGGLVGMTRAAARALVEGAGGRVTGSVSAETDYVVVGENPGSKHERALELGVPTLSEEEFASLLRDTGLEAE